MANHVNAVADLNIASTSYEDLRPNLRSGDLMFCSGEYPFSRAIRAVTNSPWSHVGLVLRADEIDRVLMLESVEDVGVRFAPLSKYFGNYDSDGPYNGDVMFARDNRCSSAIVKGLAKFGADQLTAPYNNDQLTEMMARIVLKSRRIHKGSGYICSELINACFKAAGCPFSCAERDFVSPEDIWVEPSVQALALIPAAKPAAKAKQA